MKLNLLKRIDEMRKILRWAENASIQEAKGNKIKRRKRGSTLIRQSNPISWLGKTLEQPLDPNEVEIKAAAHLDHLIDQRDDLNIRKQQIQKKIEDMEKIREGERIKPSFFQRMKTTYKNKKSSHL